MPKKLILLIGAPASGKTTDAKMIAKNHPEISAYSMGELLNKEAQKETKTAKIIHDYMDKGDLVPTGITLDIICDAVHKTANEIVLMDGFPRKEKQMKLFGDLLANKKYVELISVIEIRVSREVARKRAEALDGFNPDLFCHAMDVYEETIKNIEEFYNHDGLLRVIDGEREMSEVIDDIDAFLQNRVALAPA